MQTGARRAGQVKILNAERLNPDSKVIISGLQKIGDGQPVQILNEDNNNNGVPADSVAKQGA